jgi:hypothetical protein
MIRNKSAPSGLGSVSSPTETPRNHHRLVSQQRIDATNSVVKRNPSRPRVETSNGLVARPTNANRPK